MPAARTHPDASGPVPAGWHGPTDPKRPIASQHHPVEVLTDCSGSGSLGFDGAGFMFTQLRAGSRFSFNPCFLKARWYCKY